MLDLIGGFAAGIAGSAIWSIACWAWRRCRRVDLTKLAEGVDAASKGGRLTRARAVTAEQMAELQREAHREGGADA